MARKSYPRSRPKDLTWVTMGLSLTPTSEQKLITPQGDFPSFMASDGSHVIFTRPVLLRASAMAAGGKSGTMTGEFFGVGFALPDAKPTLNNTPKRFPLVVPTVMAHSSGSIYYWSLCGRSKAMRKVDRGEAVFIARGIPSPQSNDMEIIGQVRLLFEVN